MIASLTMYERPETTAALDALWQAIRAELNDSEAPETLTRGKDLWEVWTSPHLLLGQTCGMPFRTRLYDQVTLVATLDHGIAEAPPGHYTSVIVTHRDKGIPSLSQLAGARFAYNEALSQSGWAAPMHHMRDLGILPGELIATGAHIASARFVAEGRADFAALDAMSWALMQEYDDFAGDLVVIDRTRATPGLPLITARHRDPAPLRAALYRAVDQLADDHRKTLHLRGVCDIPAAEYLAVSTPLGPVLTKQTIRQSAAR